ncbi:MAG: beta-mannosidase [Clostridiales bacterium]|nr:beta-mannosidase [Clostridiales bacterium]
MRKNHLRMRSRIDLRPRIDLRSLALLLLLAFAIAIVGCSKAEKAAEPEPLLPETAAPESFEAEPVAPAEPAEPATPTARESYQAIYEAENGRLIGGARIAQSGGQKVVTGFEADGDGVAISIDIPVAGFYDLNFRSQDIGGYKENYIYANGEMAGTVSIESKTVANSKLERVYLEAGENEIAYMKFWGWVNLDALSVTNSKDLDQGIYQVSAKLSNPDASVNAKRLMSFLADQYGKKVLSGQYSDTGLFGKEVYSLTTVNGGKRPAVIGLDMIEYTPSRVAKGSSGKAVGYALEADEAGAVVTMCWHWNAPTRYLTGTWYMGFYTEHTNISLKDIMDGKDEEGYRDLIHDIDAIAEQLYPLRDADVPVLWRPLHEAAGGWFWWGASGAESYKQLYSLMHERMTGIHKLNNLIWLWNGQDAAWYPGDDIVDMIGEDLYPGEKVYASQIAKFLEANQYSSQRRIVALSENGCVPDPDLMARDGAWWSFFATWSGEFVRVSDSLLAYSEKYTEKKAILKAYESEHVLSLDELPDLKAYPIRE